jgi:heterodisulfide reductase subunit B
LAASDALGIRLEELNRWTCCGTMFSSGADELAPHLGPLRNLIRVQQAGHDQVITLCAMCHNTLAQVNRLVRDEPDKLDELNGFMTEEPPYEGDVEAVHFLTLLARVGLDRLSARVKRPLSDMVVAPYYGCALLRPPGAGIDDAEEPQLFERLLETIGAQVVSDPMRTECCGSYLTVKHPEAVLTRAQAIVGSAERHGATAIATMCPLCAFNLKKAGTLPVYYFTELLAKALDAHYEAAPYDKRRHLEVVP